MWATLHQSTSSPLSAQGDTHAQGWGTTARTAGPGGGEGQQEQGTAGWGLRQGLPCPQTSTTTETVLLSPS